MPGFRALLNSYSPPPLGNARYFQPPKQPRAEIRNLVRQLYGIDAVIKPLSGERDLNFVVHEANARPRILKISNSEEPENYTAFQVALLEHLQSGFPDLSLPGVVPTKQGDPYARWQFEDGRVNTVRLITYLDGTPISQTGSPYGAWAKKIGALQGRLCRALAGFEHPGASEHMPWNATCADLLDDRVLMHLEPEFRNLLAPHLERLKFFSFPRLQGSRSQVIHNDMHPGNILLDDFGDVSGIIDFGDAIEAPIIQELAVSATSLVEALPDRAARPLEDLIAGFCLEFPLASEELALLHDAMILRSILSVVLGRTKDQVVSPSARPRTATVASEVGFRAILDFRKRADDENPFGGFAT